MTTVASALAAHPDQTVSISRPGLVGRLMSRIGGPRYVRGKGFMPPSFGKTMGPLDARLPKMTNGLAVIDGSRARFYPLDALGSAVTETWAGAPLSVEVGPDGIPGAVRPDGTRPMQLFMRWYGFAYTWPQGDIYGAPR